MDGWMDSALYVFVISYARLRQDLKTEICNYIINIPRCMIKGRGAALGGFGFGVFSFLFVELGPWTCQVSTYLSITISQAGRAGREVRFLVRERLCMQVWMYGWGNAVLYFGVCKLGKLGQVRLGKARGAGRRKRKEERGLHSRDGKDICYIR